MQQVTTYGAFTKGAAAIINQNFAALQGAQQVYYVSSRNGKNNNDGLSWANPFFSIQKAIDLAVQGTLILAAPGSYDESLAIPRQGKTFLTIQGVGPRGSIGIAPSAAHASALVNHATDVAIVNLGLASPDDTGSVACQNSGNGFRAIACKFEGADQNIVLGPGTVAQVAAGTWGRGGDGKFIDCEIAWGTNGVVFKGTDFGASTQQLFEGCLFHNLATAHMTEAVGSGGSAAVTYRNIWIQGCLFDADEDAVNPTHYLALNASNSNTGLAAGNIFRVALNSGLNLVSTKLIWTGNFHPAGLSTGQPS